MADRAHEPRRLEAEGSPATRSAAALHEDELSPSRALRESVGEGESQRVGDGLPVAGPITSFPDTDDHDPPM